MPAGEASLSLAGRLWIYQAERFPVLRHGLLIAVFAGAGVTLSAHLGGRPAPGALAYGVAALLAFLLFFQLRVSDEVKDAEDDRRYRPERPVPRGLVTLGTLVMLALGALALEVLVALAVSARLVGLLALVWAWMGLMAVEFFRPAWLKARPALYLASHMLIMPLIDLLVTGVEWLPAAGAPPAGLAGFLLLSFLNGSVLELGRKTWAPEAERHGVESYSRLLGPSGAARAVLLTAGAATLAALLVGHQARALLPVGLVSLVALAVVAAATLRFMRAPTIAAQAHVEGAAGLYVLASYLATGFLPTLFAGPP